VGVEQPLALQACTWTAPTPKLHSLVLHMPIGAGQRSTCVTLFTLITCGGKTEHFQITL
jgi:hypothetical protein